MKAVFKKENNPLIKYEIIIAIVKRETNSDLNIKEEYIQESEDIASLPSFRHYNTRGTIAGLVEIAKSIPMRDT